MKKYDILIATPGAMLEAQYVKSLVETLAECDKRGITYKWLNGYSSLVHHARELTASGLEGFSLNPNQKSPGGYDIEYKKIFWIDSDIAWTTEQFFKLYESDYDVISGVYLLADGYSNPLFSLDSNKQLSSLEVCKMTEPFKVGSSGFGFITMKSGVFEKIQRPWFVNQLVQVGLDADDKPIIDSVGEDISWCIKAYQAGIEIYVDPTVLVTHMKKQAITWDHIKNN